MVSLTDKYKGKPVHFIASNYSAGSDVTDFLSSVGADKERSNFSLMTGLRGSGLNNSSIPYYGVYDHTGALVASGNRVDLEGIIEKLLKAAPDLAIDTSEYKALNFLAGQLQKKETQLKALKKVQSKLKSSSSSDEEKAEAQKLIEAVDAYIKQSFDSLMTSLEKRPIDNLKQVEALLKFYKSVPVTKELKKQLSEVTKSKDFKNMKKVDKELTKVEAKLAKMQNRQIKESFLENLFKTLKSLTKKYPDFEVSKTAETYMRSQISKHK